MMTTTAVDTLPQFEGLVLRSSGLMLAARAHLAKGEPFEAGVAWVEAGRAFAELGTELLGAGFVREAAQDVLNAIYCFLEAGDHRPADEQFERFQNFPQLEQVVETDETLAQERARLHKWRQQRRRAMDQAHQARYGQMGHPLGFRHLKDTWLDQTLAAMPGVHDWHWLAAEKHACCKRVPRSIEHYTWCVRLAPKQAIYWVLLICELWKAKRWKESIERADQAMAGVPESAPDRALVDWAAGQARLKAVVEGGAPKSLLAEAQGRLETALKLGQLSSSAQVAALLGIYLCLSRLGQDKQAEILLARTLRDYPAPVNDLAWQVQRAPSRADAEQLVLKAVGVILPHAA